MRELHSFRRRLRHAGAICALGAGRIPGAALADGRSEGPAERAALGTIGSILVVGIVLAGGCKESGQSEFVVTGIGGAESGFVARNEPIRLRFSRRISDRAPIQALVRITAGTDEIAFHHSIRDLTLVLEPVAPTGWPSRRELHVHVSPGLAGAFSSADGKPLLAAFDGTVRTTASWRDDGRPMRLVSGAETLHGVTRDHVFSLRFSLPIDPDSLRVGKRPPVVVGYRVKDSWRARFVPDVALGDDPRVLQVRPWPPGAERPFATGTWHRIVVRPVIRAVTGRRLTQAAVIDFETARIGAYQGFLSVSFAREDLPVDANRRFLAETEHPFAAPVLRPFVERAVFEDGRQAVRSSLVPFGRRPARLQLLIPGERLGAEPGLITGFAFRLGRGVDASALGDGVLFESVSFRVGIAAGRRLHGVFDDNVSAKPGESQTTWSRGATRGEWAVTLEDIEVAGNGERWLNVAFESPFEYPGNESDLVLEVRNETGATGLSSPLKAEFAGLGWASGPAPGRLSRTAVVARGAGDASSGEVLDTVFATRIRIERYLEVVSDWYETDVAVPVFDDARPRGALDATGVENRDFRFLYQGERHTGTGDFERTNWGPSLRALHGCSRIRVRIIFLPSAKRREPIEVRRLEIPYREDR